jgi:aspartate oxidase
MNLVAPNNRDKIDIIVVGTGLAGGSAAATLAEQGYNVKAFCYQDSPRRAHSIAAQGGINAAKNYQKMVTLLTDCSMTPSKVEITEQEKLTFTD